ncbi:MAG: hypothetical protein ABI763_09995 [Bacteroidota bacterium]
MKKLKFKFIALVGFVVVVITVNAQSKNDCLASNGTKAISTGSVYNEPEEMLKMKAEFENLKSEFNDFKKESGIRLFKVLKNIQLQNFSQQQKATIKIQLPDNSIDGDLYITDNYGRLVFCKNITSGFSCDINYATWFSGEYSVELFTDGELVEATAIIIKK